MAEEVNSNASNCDAQPVIDLTSGEAVYDLTWDSDNDEEEKKKKKKKSGCVKRRHSIGEKPEHDCCICTNSGAKFRLSCGHHFHRRCIDKWSNRCFKRHGKEPHCPLCRSPVKFRTVVKCIRCVD